MANKVWMTGSQDATLFLGLTALEKKELRDIAEGLDMDIESIMATGVRQRLRAWSASGDTVKAVKDDLMIEKLYRQ